MHPDAHLLRRVTKSPESIAHAEGFLAAAVITQAFWDTGWLTGSDRPQCGNEIDRSQARAFLTARGGEWAAARETWATAADLDPDWLRDIAVKLSKRPSINVDRRHKAPGREPHAPPDDVVERVRKRVEYLRSQGIDVLTAKTGDAARALNAGRFTTLHGRCYDASEVCALRLSFKRCIEWGKLSHE